MDRLRYRRRTQAAHLPAPPCTSLHLPASPCTSPASPCISLYRNASPMHHHAPPCISLHLPSLSLHLLASPYIAIHLPCIPRTSLHILCVTLHLAAPRCTYPASSRTFPAYHTCLPQCVELRGSQPRLQYGIGSCEHGWNSCEHGPPPGASSAWISRIAARSPSGWIGSP